MSFRTGVAANHQRTAKAIKENGNATKLIYDAHSMFSKTETAHANLIRCKRTDDKPDFEYTSPFKKKTDRLLLDPTNESNISNTSAI